MSDVRRGTRTARVVHLHTPALLYNVIQCASVKTTSSKSSERRTSFARRFQRLLRRENLLQTEQVLPNIIEVCANGATFGF